MKNYYSAPSGFNPNPFVKELYHEPDVELANNDDDVIKELVQYAIDLDDQIEGDFDLKYVAFEFRNNMMSFVRNGLLAFKIQSLRLYKKHYTNFKVYCKEVLKLSYWQVKRIIEAARVVMELIHAGFTVLPHNISQCEPLAEYIGTEALIENWADITSNIPEHLLTAKSIDRFLHPSETEEKVETVIKVPPKLYLQILKVAIKLDLSVVALLEFMLEKVADLHPPKKDSDDITWSINHNNI
ncbi:MAG: hypothetical protein QNJ53_22560 [Pleurocapsa sp. MO_192.B19]|nr:hypothetical protein [Pleurocapsa sp. MO_192.B19]